MNRTASKLLVNFSHRHLIPRSQKVIGQVQKAKLQFPLTVTHLIPRFLEDCKKDNGKIQYMWDQKKLGCFAQFVPSPDSMSPGCKCCKPSTEWGSPVCGYTRLVRSKRGRLKCAQPIHRLVIVKGLHAGHCQKLAYYPFKGLHTGQFSKVDIQQ